MPIEKFKIKGLSGLRLTKVNPKEQNVHRSILAVTPRKRVNKKEGERTAVNIAFEQSLNYFRDISKNNVNITRVLSTNFKELEKPKTCTGQIKYWRGKEKEIYAISVKSTSGKKAVYVLSVGKNEIELAKSIDGSISAFIQHNSKTKKVMYG